jgi:hypothetical protein
MTDRIILNFAKGGWYPRGQERLMRSLVTVGYNDDIGFCSDESQIGCPTHQEAPYAFKPAMFERARLEGRRYVLWCDASTWAIKSLGPVFDYIAKTGHMLFYNGMVGNWSTDAALKSFGIDRETALGVNEIMGCCIGLDLFSERSLEFLRIWKEKSRDGITFPGSWHNQNQECSADPRVLGHRHDQTAASIIAWKLGMEKVVAHETFYQYYENPAHMAYVEGADNDMSVIRPSVCLLNQGL